MSVTRQIPLADSREIDNQKLRYHTMVYFPEIFVETR